MAAIANLVLADGQATPVNKTFTAKRADTQLAVWKDQTSGIAIGFPTVTLSVRETANATRVEKRISKPVLEVISGSDGGYTPSPKVAYTVMSKEEIVLPNRCVLQDRKDIRAFSRNMLADTVMVNAIENLEAPW